MILAFLSFFLSIFFGTCSDISSSSLSRSSIFSSFIPRGVTLKKKNFCGKYAASVEEFTGEMVFVYFQIQKVLCFELNISFTSLSMVFWMLKNLHIYFKVIQMQPVTFFYFFFFLLWQNENAKLAMQPSNCHDITFCTSRNKIFWKVFWLSVKHGLLDWPCRLMHALNFVTQVGAKSCNIKILSTRVPSWIKIPMSLALTFGSFETALQDKFNKVLFNSLYK